MENIVSEIGIPLAVVLGAIIVGWLFKKIIHGKLQKLVKRTAFKTDDIMFEAVESQIVIWLGLGALYYVTKTSAFFHKYSESTIKFIIFAATISVAFAISKFFIGLIDVWSAKQRSSLPSTKIFTNLIRSLILVIGILVALDFIGVSITPMLTALGIGGLAVSLALKDTLSDVFAGLHILLSKKVEPGDFIELESGQQGYITNITWRNSSILERTNNVFVVPNAVLSNAIIKNYDTVDKTFSARITLGVAYESDLDFVEKVTLEVANEVIKKMEGHVRDFAPFIRYHDFGESSINFTVFFKVYEYGDQHPLLHKFIKELLIRYNKEEINIPFPIRTLYHMNSLNN